MSTVSNRLSVLLLSSLTAASTALLSVVTAPTASAVESSGTLAEANAAMDANLGSLNTQATDLGGQIGEVNATISKLEAEHAALVPVLSQKRELLKQTIREGYIAGTPSGLEVLASNKSFSGAVNQKQYRDELSSKTKKVSDDLTAVQEQLAAKLAEAAQKRDGLVALKGQLDEKIATAQAQAAAKAQLALITQNKEEEYQKLRADQASVETAAMVAGPSASPSAGRPSQAPSGGNPGFSGRSNPYPYGQCTWYVYDQTGRGQNGNAGTWRATSSTPGVGKIMIWGAGEQGAGSAGHVGVVIGVSGGNVTIRHMNWNGWGVVSTGNFRSTGKFF